MEVSVVDVVAVVLVVAVVVVVGDVVGVVALHKAAEKALAANVSVTAFSIVAADSQSVGSYSMCPNAQLSSSNR